MEMKCFERLKKIIDIKGLKQTKVAEKSKINYKTFNAILHGNRDLKADELVAICKDGLEMSVDFFLDFKFQENGNNGVT